MQLLFCDTYTNIPATHNGGWAVIKFPAMIGVDEIRILPPNAVAHTSLRDPRFTGQTNPSNFHVDFFSDNRSASMTTYELVGAMEYSTMSHNRFHPTTPLFTEKLLLNGWFTSITVAVFGTVLGSSSDAKNLGRSLLIVQGKAEGRRVYEQPSPIQNILHDPSNIDRQISELRTSSYNNEKGRIRSHADHIQIPIDSKDYGNNKYEHHSGTLSVNYTADGSRHVHDKGLHYSSNNRSLSNSISTGFLYENKGHGHRKSDLTELPDGQNTEYYERQNRTSKDSDEYYQEMGKDKKNNWPNSEYEEISEEEISYEEQSAMQEMAEDDLIFPASMMQFNPFLIELMPLEHFSPPDISNFEEEISKLINECNENDHGSNSSGNDKIGKTSKIPEIMKAIENVVNVEVIDNKIDINLFDEENGIEFLSAIEEILPLLNAELPEMIINENEVLAHELCGWALIALNSNNIVKQKVGTNIRMLKAGINLATKLCQTFSDIVNIFIANYLADKLLDILSNNCMASSIKVLIIHSLDALLDWPTAMDAFLHNQYNNEDSGYTRLMEMILSPQAARVSTALSNLIRKINFFETLNKFQNLIADIYKNQIPQIKDDFSNSDNEVDDEVVMEEEVTVLTPDLDQNKELMQKENVLIQDGENSQQGEQFVEGKDSEIEFADAEEDNDEEPEEDFQDFEHSRIPLELLICTDKITLTQTTIDELVFYLENIIKVLSTSGKDITQLPAKSFPTKAHSENIDTSSTIRTIFRMFENFNILTSVQMLITLPVVSSNDKVFQAVYSFLDLLTTKQSGLLHFAFNFKTTVCIFRHLLCSAESFSKIEIETPGTAAHLGAKLALYLQCTQCLDQLNCLLLQENSSEDDLVDILKMIYSLAYISFGKHWVASFINLNDNILAFIACLKINRAETTPDTEIIKDEKINDNSDKPDSVKTVNDSDKNEENTTDKEGSIGNEKMSLKKDAVSGYAGNILLYLVKTSMKIEYLKVHGKALYEACKETSTSSVCESLRQWLGSDKLISEVKVPELVNFIKERSDKLEWSSLCTDGLSLCTALRVICDELGLNPCVIDGSKNVNYKVALSLLSAGGIPVFTNCITKLSKCLAYPCHSQHSVVYVNNIDLFTFVANTAFLLLTLVKYLTRLTTSTNDAEMCAEYVVKPIIVLYADLYILVKDNDPAMFDNVTQLIVEIITLSANCKRKIIIGSGMEDQEELKPTKNNWNILVDEIYDFTESSCENFVPGLILFSSILPFPLPIFVDEDQENSCELEKNILEARNTVAAHFNDKIEKLSIFMATLAHSTCQALLEVLIPLYQQFIDLSDAFAIVLLKALVKKILVRKETKKVDGEGHECLESTYTMHAQVALVLGEIIKLPSAKTALLSTESFTHKIFPKMLEVILKHSKVGSCTNIEAANYLISPLLDVEITLFGEENVLSSEHYYDIAKLAVRGIQQFNLDTIDVSLHTLVLLSRYEKGFQCTKKQLSPAATADFLYYLLKQISREDCNIDICCEIVTRFLALVNCFTEVSYLVKDHRKSVLTYLDLKKLMCGADFSNNSVFEIKQKLEEIIMENDLFEYDEVVDEFTCLCQSLKNSEEGKNDVFVLAEEFTEKENLKSANEKILLSEKYKLRPTFVSGEFDNGEVMKNSIMFGNQENSFQFKNLTVVDNQNNLLDMAEKYCSGFDLPEALSKLVKFADSAELDRLKLLAKQKRKQKLETFSLRHGKSLTYMKRSHGLPNTPNIQRGRGRGMSFNHGFRPYDLFRQRKQNTSRPPSMHVDDFLAADQEDENKKVFKSPHSPVQNQYRRSGSRLYVKREYVTRGRGRGRTFSTPSYNSNYSPHYNTSNQNFDDKSRFKTSSSQFTRFTDRYKTRGREFGSTITFSPHEGFKTSKTQWNYAQRGFRVQNSTFRGGARGANKVIYGNRNHLNNTFTRTFNPHYKRGRGVGYIKPKQHSRSFTR